MKHDPTPKPRSRRTRSVLLGSAVLAVFYAIAVPVVRAAHSEPATTSETSLLTPEGSFSEVVKQARPAVVTITTERQPVLSRFDAPGSENMPFDEFFRRFFGQGGPAPSPTPPQGIPRGEVERALGSGFVVDPSGLIVTNNHVIDQAKKIEVMLDDGSKLDATLVGTDPKTDLAVLRVKPNGDLPALEWGDSDTLEAGDRIIAIGNPFGVGTTVTAGIVSARGRDLHNGPYDDFIQIDAALNHGNSGGPLLDTHGKVVGIADAIFSPNDGNVGVGFAIPSNLAQKIAAEIGKSGSVERGYLGIQIQPVSDDIAGALELDKPSGALVAEVESGTPAEKAGLLPADVIVSVDGKEIADAHALSSAIADLDPGSTVTLGVWRNDQQMDIDVTLASLPTEPEMPGSSEAGKPGTDVPAIGLSVAEITPEMRAEFGLPETESGVVVAGLDEGFSANADIRPGDVIVSVDRQEVASTADVTGAVGKATEDGRSSVLMLIDRDGQRAFVAVPLGRV